MNPISLEQAMCLAFTLGQTYWRQADSESIRQQNKAAETQVRFNTLLKETLDAANLAEWASQIMTTNEHDVEPLFAQPTKPAADSVDVQKVKQILQSHGIKPLSTEQVERLLQIFAAAAKGVI